MIKGIIFLLFFILAGCASMKANYKFCKNSDWRELGARDAKQDKVMEETYSKYKMMCASFDEGLQPDLTQYRFGHYNSIKTLCTFTKGREFGLNRKNVSNNCTKDKHKEFYRGIQVGIDEYCSFDSGVQRAHEGYNTSEVCNPSNEKHRNFYNGILKGIESYCTYNIGLKKGQQEQEYRGICSSNNENNFLRGHKKGLIQARLNSLKAQISKIEEENASLELKIRNVRNKNYTLKNKNFSLQRALK